MTIIVVRLIGESEDLLFRTIDINNEILYSGLLKRIEAVTAIRAEFQELQFRGEVLPIVEQPLLTIKFGEEVIVKHSQLPVWEQYKQNVLIALKPGRERQNSAIEAVRIHKRLMEIDFFLAYPSFNSFRLDNHHMIASWTDGNIRLMKEATKSHFLQQHYKNGAHDETNFTCRFEARPYELGGSRKNTLAFIQLYGQKKETKYNIKYHHFGSSSTSNRGRSPDIKELYCYKLLELIHIGPQAQFILSDKFTSSKTSLYIATRWNDNFTPLSSMTEDAVDVDVLLKILLLGNFLFIDDLHSQNCGIWKDTKEIAIVDFMPRAFFTYTNIERAFCNNQSSVYWDNSHIDALTACDETTRSEMWRECLIKWDLLSKIDIAYEKVVQEKNRMQLQQIGFKGFHNASEELDQYISTIKQNIMKLSEFLKASE